MLYRCKIFLMRYFSCVVFAEVFLESLEVSQKCLHGRKIPRFEFVSFMNSLNWLT